jgi:hypothetical protein
MCKTTWTLCHSNTLSTNQKLAHWDKYLRREKRKLFTTGTSKVKLEKAIELVELRFHKKKNIFEGVQDVLEL